MKTCSTVFLLLIALISSAQKKTGHFKVDLDFGSGIVISTFFDVSVAGGRFAASSPENADVRIMGGKAKIARLFGKSPKKGIIVTIKGAQKADSLFGNANVPRFGKLKFKGILKDSVFNGAFSNDDIPVGRLHGISSEDTRNDYKYLYPIIIKTIQDHIYSKEALQNEQWEKGKKEIEDLCQAAYDDIELIIGFGMLSQKLPFTHLSLVIAKDVSDEDGEETTTKSVIFEEKNAAVAYLKIKNFSTSTQELAEILPNIVKKPAYTNLIIDLRDNGGGGIDAAFELAKYIVNEDMEVGYFVTNKLQYTGYQPELFKTLPSLQPKSTEEFGKDLRRLPGVKLVFKKPANPVFDGKLFILTNRRTGSTCEPMVYALKKTAKALIIGENTYGGMLAASSYNLSDKYNLMVPIADFYTYDGNRLDKVGVPPDIKVKSEDALQKAMEIINTYKK